MLGGSLEELIVFKALTYILFFISIFFSFILEKRNKRISILLSELHSAKCNSEVEQKINADYSSRYFDAMALAPRIPEYLVGLPKKRIITYIWMEGLFVHVRYMLPGSPISYVRIMPKFEEKDWNELWKEGNTL